MVRGVLSAEKEAKVPASKAWEVYGTLRLSQIGLEKFPDVASKVEVLQGDGSAGTIIKIHFYAGAVEGGVSTYTEKFTVVDNERRIKVAELVEGGYLHLGFTSYLVRIEVMEKEGEPNQCITRSTIEFELKEEAVANAGLPKIQYFTDLMEYVADYLHQNHNNQKSP